MVCGTYLSTKILLLRFYKENSAVQDRNDLELIFGRDVAILLEKARLKRRRQNMPKHLKFENDAAIRRMKVGQDKKTFALLNK